jgi:hypothetical protein
MWVLERLKNSLKGYTECFSISYNMEVDPFLYTDEFKELTDEARDRPKEHLA